MSASGPQPLPETLAQRRPRIPDRLRWLLIGIAVAASLYLVSPFITLWRLNVIVVNGPTSALSTLVDIEAVRDQLKRRLNKDRVSTIGELSDPFIDWIQEGIRRHGSEALTGTITLSWLRQLLLTHAQGQDGIWPAISDAFFDSPTRFRVQIGQPSNPQAGPLDRAEDAQPMPVQLQLARTWLGWRVIAASY